MSSPPASNVLRADYLKIVSAGFERRHESRGMATDKLPAETAGFEPATPEPHWFSARNLVFSKVASSHPEIRLQGCVGLRC